MENEISKKLHIFTREGHTFTFFDALLESDNETTIVFRYTAQSDGAEKRAIFNKRSIAGWSYTTT